MKKDDLLINYMRVTSCLEIERANSGHPGVALGSAPIFLALYKNMFFNPKDPKYINRDRVVFSAGHASALVYATLHLFGFDVSNKDLQNFRQLNSKTCGHPEVELSGIDASTGPLGQGIAMSVGLAIAERYLGEKYKTSDGQNLINHYTYCFCGDGCLMEGVAQEAISLAGNLALNKLILLYDKNDITIEGSTNISNKEDVAQKFNACNWNVLDIKNGNDVWQIEKAIKKAQHSNKPTIIICHTQIGFGSEFAGQSCVHGKPLNKEQIQNLRKNLNYFEKDFVLPQGAKEYVDELLEKKIARYNLEQQLLSSYKEKEKANYHALFSSDFKFKYSPMATFDKKIDMRKAGKELLNSCNFSSSFLGGSADLSPSTMFYYEDAKLFDDKNFQGKTLSFGIREHAMGAICNGIALHNKGIRAFCSTFLSFENYMTPAIRLSALMNVPVLYYFSHDSIAVGEDGPTHQPIEQLATLRAMPNLVVFRPCGKNELAGALEYYFSHSRPVAIVIPRQTLDFVCDSYEKASLGGYIIKDEKKYKFTLCGAGSDCVTLCNVAQKLAQNGLKCRVVSMVSTELFDAQSIKYKDSILDKSKPIVCVESSSDNIWYRYATSPNHVLKLDTFGLSGKANDVLDYFGMSEKKLYERILNLFEKK